MEQQRVSRKNKNKNNKNKNKNKKKQEMDEGGLQTLWLKMNKLLVAATAMQFSVGCQAWWSIFLLKSMLSTLKSSFFFLPRLSFDLAAPAFFLKAKKKKTKEKRKEYKKD